jgi:uncharacterized protein (TIGR03086 family)
VSEISERYRRNADRFAELVAGVPSDRWSSPSPCDDWTARDVVRHVVETQGLFLGLVGDTLGDVPSVDDDPAAAWDAARAVVQARLDDPARAGTEFDGALGRTSFEASVDRFLSSDLVMHGWDLARATGQDDAIDPAEAERVLADAQSFPPEAFRSPMVAGPEVPVPADADLQTRVLAFYGRTP